MLVKVLIFNIIAVFLLVKPAFASSVMLNELMVHPQSDNDWIELYNSSSNTIDLTNWTLVDSTSTIKTLSGSISANGFIAFDVTNRLNNGGDSIYLKDASGNTIDNYSYNSDPGIDKTSGGTPQ